MKLELWRECAIWLSKAGLIPPNDPTVIPDSGARIEDFIAKIRDGAVLCQLLNAIEPGAVEPDKVLYDYAYRRRHNDSDFYGENVAGGAVSDFLCRHNVFLFLQAAISRFDLDTAEHFFEPEDLYQCRDVGKVLAALSAISHLAKVKKSLGISGFPKKEKSLAKRLAKERAELYEDLNQIYGETETEQLYESFFNRSAPAYYCAMENNSKKNRQANNLNNKTTASKVNNNQTVNTTADATATSFIYGAEASMYEDIYQTIFPPKQPRLSLDLGGIGASGFAKSNGSIYGAKSKKLKRNAPIEELLDTEDKYLENLIMVKDVFREKLSLMSAFDKSVIFCQWDELITLHGDILFALKGPKNKVTNDIGRVFLEFAQRMRSLYSVYCVNLPEAMDKLQEITTAEAGLRKQVYDCQLKAKPATFPLSSHLVIPFQRFLKYHLLLKEIVKLTPKEFPDYSSLERAAETILGICSEVNELKREHEEIEKQVKADEADLKMIEKVTSTIKLMQLPKGSKGLTEFGRLRKAGETSAYAAAAVQGATPTKVADYAFLFDMVIVLCHKPKWLQHRYRFRLALKVKDFYVQPLPEWTNSHVPEEVFSVRLFRKVDPTIPALVLIVKTASERDSWFNAILAAMDAVTPSENDSTRHVLALATFKVDGEDKEVCSECGKGFRGIFFQGYKCLRCRANLHKACIGLRPCLEVGLPAANSFSYNSPQVPSASSIKRSDSIVLPTALPDNLERSGSTLSLAPPNAVQQDGTGNNKRNSGSKLQQQVLELQTTAKKESEAIPLEEQPYYAGALAAKVAHDRLEGLPVGTFLVRKRNNGLYALMLKTPEAPKGVKSMAVQVRHDFGTNGGAGKKSYFFSGARSFDSIQKMVSFYRNQDLTENFDYPSLQGITLKIPYKSL